MSRTGEGNVFDPKNWTLHQKLASGACLDALWLSLGSVALCEIAARSQPALLVIDIQHGLWDRATVEAAIAVAGSVAVMVRVADHSAYAISSALDAGAQGIIVPLVETVEQAQAAVAAARFPPHGARSGGGLRPTADFPAYVAAAKRGTVVSVMIETRAGLANAHAIAGVPGLDMIFIGTGDLALSLGTFPDFGPEHERACADILEACRAHNVACGLYTGSMEAACAMRERGYRMVVTATDSDMAARSFAQAREQFHQPPTKSKAKAPGRTAGAKS